MTIPTTPKNRWIGETIDLGGDGEIDQVLGFVYDGDQVVLQFDRGLSQISSDEIGTVPLGVSDLSHRYLWQPNAVDQLMADEQTQGLSQFSSDENGTVPLGSAGTVVWTLGDNQGTIKDLAVTDPSTGVTSIVTHRIYDAFGNLKSQTGAVDCLFGYTGRAFDQATGLQNNLNRWYDAKVGRWASEDPLGFNGKDTNVSRYVGNSPTNATDSVGLAVYKLNRPLSAFIKKAGEAEPRWHMDTHTFVYTTDANGKLISTYSWGNSFEKEYKGKHYWFSNGDTDTANDVASAETDIDANNKEGERMYDDTYNDAVAKAFALLQNDTNSGSGHPWGVPFNCKHEAAQLIALAAIVKDKGVAAAQQYLATHYWTGVFYAIKPGAIPRGVGQFFNRLRGSRGGRP